MATRETVTLWTWPARPFPLSRMADSQLLQSVVCAHHQTGRDVEGKWEGRFYLANVYPSSQFVVSS